MAGDQLISSIRILDSEATTPPQSSIARAQAKKYISEGYLLGQSNRSMRIDAQSLTSAILEADISGRSRVSLANVEIEGKLDLGGADIRIPVQFTSCKFHSAVALTSARLHLLRLDSCQLPGIEGRDIEVDGSLLLAGCVVRGTVYLHNARIGGDLDLTMCRFSSGENPGIFARQAQIGGALNAKGVQIKADSRYPLVNLDGTEVRGVTAFDAGRMQNTSGSVISANQMRAHGGLSIGENFVGVASVDIPAISMNGLISDGLVIVRQATVVNHRGTAIRGIGMKLGQNLVVDGDVQVEGSGKLGAIRLNQSNIDGMASFENIRVANVSGPAISIDGSKIGGGGQFRNMRLLSSGNEGAISFKSCEIGLQWEFHRLTIICAKGPALSFDQTRVATSLHLDELKIKGSSPGEALIRIPGVRVGGQMTISGQLNNRSGAAVRADGLRVAGSLRVSRLRAWCSDERTAISFASLQVDGQVDIDDCKIRNITGRGISFQSANITNNLTVTSSSIEGLFESLRLYGTQVRDSLVVTNTFIHASARDQIAILMQATEVGGVLRIDVDQILASGVEDPIYVDLDELRYGSLPMRATDQNKWLKLLKEHTRDYSPQPYEHLSGVYKKAGQRESARTVLVSQETERSRRALAGREWLWNEIKGRAIGYGYRPMRALTYIAGLWLVSVAAIIGSGATYGVIDNLATSAPRDCSVLAQLSFSTEVAIPLIGTGFRLQSCGVDTSMKIGQWMLIFLGAIRILAWFFAALFVAGFTGMVKKE